MKENQIKELVMQPASAGPNVPSAPGPPESENAPGAASGDSAALGCGSGAAPCSALRGASDEQDSAVYDPEYVSDGYTTIMPHRQFGSITPLEFADMILQESMSYHQGRRLLFYVSCAPAHLYSEDAPRLSDNRIGKHARHDQSPATLGRNQLAQTDDPQSQNSDQSVESQQSQREHPELNGGE